MNRVKCRAVFAALLALCPCAAKAAGFVEVVPRPSRAVFDPSGILNAAESNEISEPLERILKDEGVEVIAVVVEDSDAANPQDLATNMAATWCKSSAYAVALHIPGKEGTPWIVAGGDPIRSINPDELRDELAAVRRDASREPDDVSTLRTAAIATADMLRYWKGREATRLGVVERARASIRSELETRARRQQAIMLAVGITLIAGVITALRLLGKIGSISSSKP